MLLVETFVGPSKIEGVGVFALVDIREGSKLWILDKSFDRLIPDESLLSMPVEIQKFVERYSYKSPEFPGHVLLETDNGRFMNHARNPNVSFADQYSGFAARDIAAGEELTCDYNELEPGFKLLPSLVAEGMRRKARRLRINGSSSIPLELAKVSGD